ncbi:hypothetical protein KR018_003117 [Drosophila ironensis]|nr:hypothetical protein KR018_003117 [Drosophila ironensis]
MDDDEEEVITPHYARKYRMPSDPVLLCEYNLFRPTAATLNLESERNRATFAEAFIEGEMDTLEHLCVKSLAKLGIRGITPMLLSSPELMRIFYDAVDVEMPLSQCYMIDDQRFWRRVVLSKTMDKTLHLKRWNEFDWKAEGVSRKFVERMEACPVAVEPQRNLALLAGKVWQCVNSMHVRHLQVLPPESFSKFIGEDSEQDITSASSDEETISSDEPSTELDEGEEEEEGSVKEVEIQLWRLGSVEEDSHRRDDRHKRNKARQDLRDMAAKKREEREERRKKMRDAREARANPPPPAKKKKKKKAPPLEDVFKIPVDPEPEDDEDTKPDRRNILMVLSQVKQYDYPQEHCHHIDLGCVRTFLNLVSFTLEFLGPHVSYDYHKRYTRFSYADMMQLARGLRCLPHLKIFRLRNSRIDMRKLRILARTLRLMDSLEEIDFGYALMPDNCSEPLSYLLNRPRMFRKIQLENNFLGAACATVLAKAMAQEYQEGVLEYLGLANNPMSESILHSLIQGIIGTPHVIALNISGIGSSTRSLIGRELSLLLRNHPPLLSLEMSAINIGNSQGLLLLRALYQNQRILYVDCRECDLTPDQEFEANMIVRRNRYINTHMQHGEELCTMVKEGHHPIVQRIEDMHEAMEECQRVRPPFEISHEEIVVEKVEEKKEEEERDIWAILGITQKPAQLVEPIEEARKSPAELSLKLPFVYDANSFNLDQFRESVSMPGPGNRFFYLQKNKMP